MAWETRRGNLYYYRSRRSADGRVRKEYCGTGPEAIAEAKADEVARDAARQARDELLRIAEEAKTVNCMMNDLDDAVRMLTAGTLLAAGYHQHRGHWRKRRD